MKRKILPIVFCAILLFIFLNGCGAAGLTGQSNSTAAYAPAVQNENVMDMQDTAETASPGRRQIFSSSNVMVPAEISVEQKIIWTVDMEVETLEFDSFLSNLESGSSAFWPGYLESSSVSGSSIQYTSNRYGTVTVRIPSAQLDAFLDQVGKIGTVTYTNKSSEDITLDYVDVESRIEALEVEQERLLALRSQRRIWNPSFSWRAACPKCGISWKTTDLPKTATTA